MISWTMVDVTEIDIREMTDAHLTNARNAVAEGRINPSKHNLCHVPFGSVNCSLCDLFAIYRVVWLVAFDHEMTRRGIGLLHDLPALVGRKATPTSSRRGHSFSNVGGK